MGLGGAITFSHPDLAWRAIRLDLEGMATSRGQLLASAALATPGTWFLSTSGSVAHLVTDTWDGDGAWTEITWDAVSGTFLGGHRWDHLQVRAGPSFLWADADGDRDLGWGPQGDVALDHRRGALSTRRGWRLGLGLTSSLPVALLPGSDPYAHLGATADARLFVGGPWDSVWAFRLVGQGVLWDEIPFYRLPSAGGDDLLRGAPAGRYRGPLLGAADVEWRKTLFPTLEGVLFLDGAAVEGTGVHPGGGAGIRLALPPGNQDVVRFDVAASDAGWEVTAGWGEVF